MTQQDKPNRVNTNISALVEAFVQRRWQSGQRQFYMRDLHDYIFARTQIAPASPGRILRQLRQKGKFDYEVINRSTSCYQLISIGSRRTVSNSKTVTLLHRGKPVDRFPVNGKRFRLPAHVIEHLHPSSDFELEITT